jgi:hypothetical protein
MVLFWMAGAMVKQDFNQTLLMDAHGIPGTPPKVKYWLVLTGIGWY